MLTCALYQNPLSGWWAATNNPGARFSSRIPILSKCIKYGIVICKLIISSIIHINPQLLCSATCDGHIRILPSIAISSGIFIMHSYFQKGFNVVLLECLHKGMELFSSKHHGMELINSKHQGLELISSHHQGLITITDRIC